MTQPISNCNKTRIAPTPSGFLHIGNILSFVATAGMAQKSGAKILLRIDDLDQARVNKGYLQNIFDTLNFLGIPWDEGPRNVKEFEDSWSQIHRMGVYNEAIEMLVKKGSVFACTCSRRQIKNLQPCTCVGKYIPLDTENAAWRLITGTNELEIRDYNGKITRAALPPGMQNFVIRRRDGIPSYQLTSVADDLYYNIDLIVRGQDLWPSTIAQHELTDALGEKRFNSIKFYHHPLLMASDGKKLSKSAGSASVNYLQQNGKRPADIYTLIAAMLGINKKVSCWQQLAEIINLGTW